MKVLQKGFNYSQDGPGNRLVYHLQGCNFACKWCSNADSIPLENPEAKEIPADEIFDEIMRSRPMFFDGGGVTFTGGECTLHFGELLPLFKRLRGAGVSVCAETNGSHPDLRLLAEYIDCLIIDCKLTDDEAHKKYTGASNRKTLENIEFFLRSGRELHIRIPLINGVNTGARDFAEYFSQFDTSHCDFEFLPYHEFGKDKWQGKYEMTDAFVSAETVGEFERIFNEYGLKTVKT
ncbi:MAG: radical SAM protein [Clostridia bacterium]|nr:radical SAM protein [Clostridia bacterium]